MKKYLINQDQMDFLLRILRCYPLMHEELKKFKPIEPLTYEQIEECCTTEVNRNEINFARAIEAHIIGETP